MKKLAILVYGVVGYAVFFSTFLYLIGFVAGAVVPRTIDSGPLATTPLDWILNIGFLVLFGVQHTIMARHRFKAWWTRIIPAAAERTTFVLVTCAILGLMFWQWRALPGVVWSVQTEWLRYAIYAAAAAGWAIVLVASFQIDHFELFGLRQTWLAFRGREDAPPQFQTRGFYRIVRHPLMLGFLLAMWSAPDMSVGHLLFAGVMSLYILVGVTIEERSLLAVHPTEYATYRSTTRSLIPLPMPRRSSPRTPAALPQ